MGVLSQKGGRSAIYRGQPNTEWTLVPSIFRTGAVGIDQLDLLQKWKERVSRFASPLPMDDVEWLILAQHYGLATPLLDWTISPLVALFFACDDEKSKDAPGEVWQALLDEFSQCHYTSTVNAFGKGETRVKPFLINAIGRNTRSTAQDSLLSLHTANDYQGIRSERIFTIAPNRKATTLKALDKLSLNSERLHVDIAKLVDRFKEEILTSR